MKVSLKPRWIRRLVIGLLLLFAWGCRLISPYTPISWWLSLARSLIYIGLFLVWGISMYARVMQVHCRRYLAAIAGLIVFWMLVRTAKFLFVDSPALRRYLWYLYYLPQIYIPLMAVMASSFLGKPESWKKPWWISLLYMPAAFFLVLVLSNDSHQLVFSLAHGLARFSNGEYHHEFGYFLILAWIGLCIGIAFYHILTRSRCPESGRRIWMPLLVIGVLVTYAILYIFDWPYLHLLSTDMTTVSCLFIVLFFEICFANGLIQTNTQYMELFQELQAPAALLNSKREVELCSASMPAIEPSMLENTGPLALGNGLILKQMPIRGGSIAWVEDVAMLEDLKTELEEKARQLAEEKDLLEAEIRLKEKKTVTETRSHLYDMALRQLARPFARLQQQVLSLPADPVRQKQALAHICVTGAYLKRRCNMLILEEEQDVLSVDVLYHALRESCDCLAVCGVDCHMHLKGAGQVRMDAIKEIYDRFQAVIDVCLPQLEALLVLVHLHSARLDMKMQAEVKEPVILEIEGLDTDQEDGLLLVRTSVPAIHDLRPVEIPAV